MAKQFWFFPLIFALSLFLFYPSLNYYFFQDDWFVLNWVKTGDFLSFFKFRVDTIYWRPLSMPLFFWIGKSIFGLNPIGYHLISFTIHFLNILLLGYISYLIFKDKKASLVSALLYATASFHFMTLSWLSLTWNAIGFFFFQTSLIFYLINRNNRSLVSHFGFTASFLLSLASNEFAVVFPFWVIILEIMSTERSKEKIFNTFKTLAPIFSIIFAYLFVRTIIFSVPTKGEYELVLDFRIFKNLFWYGLWFFNLPEELKNQIVLSNLQVTQNFLNAAKNFLPIILFAFIVNLFLFVFMIFKTLNKKTISLLFAASIFFTIALLPVLFFTQHSFPYYLTVPSESIFIFIGFVVSNYSHQYKSIRSTIFISAFIITWLVSSYTTLSLTKKIHWVTAEENLSRKSVNFARNKNPTLPAHLIIEIPNSNRQIIQSLMDQNAFQVIYNNDEVKTIYK